MIVTVDPLKQTVLYQYNKVGEVIRMTDQAGNVTQLEYNLLGLVENKINALGHQESFVMTSLDKW